MACSFNQNVSGNSGSVGSSGSNSLSKQNATPLLNGPMDTVSQLNWSGDGNFLACASWDRSVRVWQVNLGFGQTNIQTSAKTAFQHDAPLLTTCFGPNSDIIFAGGCDKIVKMYDINNNQGQVIGQHDQPISCICWNPTHSVLVSASWDGYVKMWDGKQQHPVWQQSLGSKIFCMAQNGPFITICDNTRAITVFNLQQLQSNPNNAILKVPSPLKMQIRSLGMFPDTEQCPGFAVGSIEGRCSIFNLKEEHRQSNFTFKCHRHDTGNNNGAHIYAVNAISFSPKQGSFATCGSDGTIVFWDKDHRQRLKVVENMGAPVTDFKFNPTGNNICAYSIGYDWHKGFDQQELNKGVQVYLYLMKDEDLRPRPKNQQRR